MIANIKEQSRNEKCNCGSGDKYKNCCGKVVVPLLTMRDMMKCLYLLLQGAAEENLAIPHGPIPFSKELLAAVPDDLVNQIMVAENEGFLVLTVKKKKGPVLYLPDKKLVT